MNNVGDFLQLKWKGPDNADNDFSRVAQDLRSVEHVWSGSEWGSSHYLAPYTSYIQINFA